MSLTAVNHLAFITDDMTKTVRFYRDLLGMPLTTGIGHDGFRHYFFGFGDCQIAFFEYDGAAPMKKKFPGVMTSEPLGFDHVSLTVGTCAGLFAYRDKVQAAGFQVHGPVDHGVGWSIYFYDPNNIPLEITWDCLHIREPGTVVDDNPLPIVAEGGRPQPGHWPEVTSPTPPSGFRAKSGNGHAMRRALLEAGAAGLVPGVRLDGDEVIPE